MRWEEIQRKLRYKLGELFSHEQSIRSIVRDIDSTLEAFVVWNGNAVDCWSGILREARFRHLELDLVDAARLAYPQDEVLRKAEDDIKKLISGTASTVTSTPISSPPVDATKPINVFISYAQDDEKFQKQLETHLALLKREGVISPWHSQQAKVGETREQQIANHIDSAQIILLLMSPSFIASDQLYVNEMMRALNRQRAGDAVRVIPIAVRHIALGDPDKTPFQKIQGLPRNGKPIDAWRSADEAWAAIAQEIREVCKDLRGGGGRG